MTGATSRATSANGGQGQPLGPRPPGAQHGATRAASGGDGRPLPMRSDLDLCGKLAALHEEIARIYRELGEVQLAAPRGQALMDGMVPGRLLSVGDLAELLQIDPKTVRRWREAGKLPPGIEIGGIVRWRSENVDAWLEEQRG